MSTLTDLQKNVMRVLLAHRFYNLWSYEPTTLATQQEIAAELNVERRQVQGALKKLTAAGYIRPLWTARKGQPQIYLITHPGHIKRPDLKARYRLMQQTVPGKAQIDRLRNKTPAPPAPIADPGPNPYEEEFENEQHAQAVLDAMLAEQPDLEGTSNEETGLGSPRTA